MGLSNKQIREMKAAKKAEAAGDDLMGDEPTQEELDTEASEEPDLSEIREALDKQSLDELLVLAKENGIPARECKGKTEEVLRDMIEGVLLAEALNAPGVEPEEHPLVVNEMWRWAGKIVTIRAVGVDEGEVRITVAWRDRFENMQKMVTLPESRFRIEAEPYVR